MPLRLMQGRGLKYARHPLRYARLPLKYVRLPPRYVRLPLKYMRLPPRYARLPLRYARLPLRYVRVPLNYAHLHPDASLPAARAARRMIVPFDRFNARWSENGDAERANEGAPYTPAMSDEPRDRYEEEALRLVRLLSSMARENRVSIRSLEKKMGVGDSVFSKVLRGKITPQVRHVLMIAEALEVGWPELFARAYGLRPAAVRPAAPAGEEDRMVSLLLRLGLIDAETARRILASPEEP